MAKNNFIGNFVGKNARIGRCVTIIDGIEVNSTENIVIVNGQVIGDGSINSAMETKHFDEKQGEEIRKIKKITISSSTVDVNVFPSESLTHVEAHFYGRVDIKGNVEFKACLVEDEFRISVGINGCCSHSNLNLDVRIPNKMLEAIFIKATSADVKVEKGITVEYLMAKTASGNVSIDANFGHTDLNTASGDIELFVHPTRDISATVSTMSGDIFAEFDCIRKLNLFTKCMSGDVTNRFRNSVNGYVADVKISTMSGDIKIR